jgi:hypothetical protein
MNSPNVRERKENRKQKEKEKTRCTLNLLHNGGELPDRVNF